MARKTVERNISYDDIRQMYYVCMDSGRDEQGRRCRAYQTAPTLKQARALLRKFESERLQNRITPPSTRTLREWLEYWLEEIIVPSRAETTAYGYRKIIDNHLIPALGHIPIQRLTPQDIQCYYTFLLRNKQLSPNTIRRHHDLLAAALHSAVRQNILSSCPLDRVEPPRKFPVETAFYTAEELRVLYALVSGSSLELPVKLAGCLGLRREEICGLRWSHVDFERRLVHICVARTSAGSAIVEKEPKNRSSIRTLHMADEIFRLLQQERQKQETNRSLRGSGWPDTGLVVVDCNGFPPTPNALSLAFSRFVTKHDLPKLTLHGLRHTFATVASAQGAPLFDISKALGHATPAITGKIYTHLTDQNHTATLDRVAEAIR